MTKIEFFFDIVSPYSYVLSTQIEKLADKYPVEIEWRPFFLGGLFKTVGNQSPIAQPLKAKFLFNDLKRIGAYYQIPFTFPKQFPSNTITIMRVLCMLENKEISDFAKKFFQLYWGEGQDTSGSSILESILGKENLALAKTDEAKEKLKTVTQEAADRGAFGAPTIFINDQMYFGSDRLFLIEDYLSQLN
ncbi:MAG: 2-hydroxychromene-2-carboxylate isomerase [bacterium]|jgi:2-hydroxychromene-2-carboxylate isomerase